MFLKNVLLFAVGISAGGVIAAGIFAFLAIIGVFPRLIAVTGTQKNIPLCETMLILGGSFGNIISLYRMTFLPGGFVLLAVGGLSMGIFVGCLVMSLAETLKAIPVLSRRIRMTVGIQYMIAAVAAGKFVGSILYFLKGFGGT